MPLVAQAATGEMQRMARIHLRRARRHGGYDEAGASARRRKPAIGEKAGPRGGVGERGPGGEGPLLRACRLEQAVVEAADVEVAPDGARGMLGEDGLRPGVVEHARGLRLADARREGAREVARDAPVR